MSNNGISRTLIVKGIEEDDLKNIKELLVEEQRTEDDSSSDLLLNAENVKKMVEEVIITKFGKYSITNKEMYWLERQTPNANINNVTISTISTKLVNKVYIDVLRDSENDITTYTIDRVSKGINITFTELLDKPYRQDGYIKEEKYIVKIYSDAEKTEIIGTENISIKYMYLSSSNRLTELCRAVGTVFYIGPNGTARLNIESNTSFPIHVEYDYHNSNNDDLDVVIDYENNNSDVVTVTMTAGDTLKQNNSEERAIKCIKVYSTTNRTLLKTIEYLVVFNPNSTDPLD